MGFSCLRADRDDGGHLRASYRVCPREHDGAVQYRSPMKGPIMASTAPSRLPVHLIFNNDDEPELDRAHMIKREQLIADMDATLSLGISICPLKADQRAVNGRVRCQTLPD